MFVFIFITTLFVLSILWLIYVAICGEHYMEGVFRDIEESKKQLEDLREILEKMREKQ